MACMSSPVQATPKNEPRLRSLIGGADGARRVPSWQTFGCYPSV